MKEPPEDQVLEVLRLDHRRDVLRLVTIDLGLDHLARDEYLITALTGEEWIHEREVAPYQRLDVPEVRGQLIEHRAVREGFELFQESRKP